MEHACTHTHNTCSYHQRPAGLSPRHWGSCQDVLTWTTIMTHTATDLTSSPYIKGWGQNYFNPPGNINHNYSINKELIRDYSITLTDPGHVWLLVRMFQAHSLELQLGGSLCKTVNPFQLNNGPFH